MRGAGGWGRPITMALLPPRATPNALDPEEGSRKHSILTRATAAPTRVKYKPNWITTVLFFFHQANAKGRNCSKGIILRERCKNNQKRHWGKKKKKIYSISLGNYHTTDVHSSLNTEVSTAQSPRRLVMTI